MSNAPIMPEVISNDGQEILPAKGEYFDQIKAGMDEDMRKKLIALEKANEQVAHIRANREEREKRFGLSGDETIGVVLDWPYPTNSVNRG